MGASFSQASHAIDTAPPEYLSLLQSAGMALVAAVRSIGFLAYAQRILFGVGAGTILTAYFTYASDLVPERRRTEGIALFADVAPVVEDQRGFVAHSISNDLGVVDQVVCLRRAVGQSVTLAS